MPTSTQAGPRKASKRLLKSLGNLMARKRIRLHELAEETGKSIGFLSETCRGIVPGSRSIDMGEYRTLRSAIRRIAARREQSR